MTTIFFSFYSTSSSPEKENTISNRLVTLACGLRSQKGLRPFNPLQNRNLKATLKGAFQFLHDTPARREDYTSITGSVKFPLYFCATRWIEDSVVADRLIKIWENIIKVVKYFEKFPKSKQPSSKSFLYVQKAVYDVFSPAKFQFCCRTL